MTIADVVLLVALGLGFFVGYTRGLIRALVAVGAWAVCFLLGSWLRAPIGDWLTRSAGFESFYANMISFGAVFFVLFIAALLAIMLSRNPTSLTGHALFDNIAGGAVGAVVAVLVVAAVIVMLASYYRIENPPSATDVGALSELHRAVQGSAIANAIANSFVHWIAFLLGPFLPAELLQVM